MTKIMNLFTSKNHLSPDEILKKYFNELQLWRNEENEIDILVQLVNAIRPRNPKKIQQISVFPIIEFFTNNNRNESILWLICKQFYKVKILMPF